MLKAPKSPAPELVVHVAPEIRVPKGNLLLASLPAADRLRLIGDRPPVDLTFSQELNQPGDRIRHVYFPIDSFISLITPGVGRAQLEIGLVGNEGMLGVPLLLGVNVTPLRALVQGAGHAWRVDAATFTREIESNPATRAALNRYLYVFLSQLMQTATCTRFHLVEARLARWLLMTRDRAHSSQFHVTHEFLAYMLGVRRVGSDQRGERAAASQAHPLQPWRPVSPGCSRTRARGMSLLRHRQENLLAHSRQESRGSGRFIDNRCGAARRVDRHDLLPFLAGPRGPDKLAHPTT